MKRSHKETMKSVLEVLSSNREYSYGAIERRANLNWRSVRDHVELLSLVEAVNVSKENRIKINDKGRILLRKLKNVA